MRRSRAVLSKERNRTKPWLFESRIWYSLVLNPCLFHLRCNTGFLSLWLKVAKSTIDAF